ncbi:sulfotransferase family 2 domain-containing protein [Marinomonas gallaica]|uniref:sulfotransferase family 2 domain-containing protein n=1 Tax=Marinomonas gallaica TaxID=1806667 RepID=UPI003A8EB5EE
MRKETFKQLALKVINKDVFSLCYDKSKVIYIHIPKAAGTSICHALFGDDPWHYNADELKLINAKKFNSYKKVAFVRDPLDRIVSTYLYSKKHISENPGTSISFMKNIADIDDFIENFLDENLVNGHYFFWRQSSYLNCEMDFIGKFENIKEDFNNMCSYLGVDINLQHKNKSIQKDNTIEIKKENIEKIYSLYSDDYEMFGYEKRLNPKIIIK